MLRKTLAAAFLIASGPLSANELADLVNSSQAIRDTFKEGIKAVGGAAARRKVHQVAIGDDTVVGTSVSIVGHDLVVGCHQMLRNAVNVPAACRVGEAARLGAGTVVTSAEVPPLYSTVSNERA